MRSESHAACKHDTGPHHAQPVLVSQAAPSPAAVVAVCQHQEQPQQLPTSHALPPNSLIDTLSDDSYRSSSEATLHRASSGSLARNSAHAPAIHKRGSVRVARDSARGGAGMDSTFAGTQRSAGAKD